MVGLSEGMTAHHKCTSEVKGKFLPRSCRHNWADTLRAPPASSQQNVRNSGALSSGAVVSKDVAIPRT